MLTSIEPCKLWERGKTPAGYGVTYERSKQEYVHRVAYEKVHGPIPAGMMVCHACDNRACYEPSHLFLGTHRTNQLDKVEKGRQTKGMDCHLSKLLEEAVLDIFHDQRSYRAIAADHGIRHGTVGAIKRGESWKHLTQKA